MPSTIDSAKRSGNCACDSPNYSSEFGTHYLNRRRIIEGGSSTRILPTERPPRRWLTVVVSHQVSHFHTPCESTFVPRTARTRALPWQPQLRQRRCDGESG